ncbi:unnamed protein product [Phaedon cochleariae]|uniref:Protein sleepless n=1 Tax=Phaedon cochleariae TaxID=80249 RepID=A0A9N9X1T9_PHACE|nr:unnamed protein product [Phaedon cochleariae]
MWLTVFGSVLVLTVVGVQNAHGVQCYSCFSSSNHDDCAIPDQHEISLVKCDMKELKQTQEFASHIDTSYNKLFEVDSIESQPGRMGLACLKMITKHGNKHYVLRGCQLAEKGNLDICRKVQETNNEIVKTVHCSKCTTEGCNTSPKYESNTIITLLFAVCSKILHKTLL